MSTATAKVFKSGNSQALRLPRAFRLRAKEVTLTATNGGFLVTDPAVEARRLKALRKLRGSAPNFPDHRS
jgi:antitoxin VapB